jgi:hypothetical protein
MAHESWNQITSMHSIEQRLATLKSIRSHDLLLLDTIAI